jgi:4-amino-4-deoxy-L-arabinose transferase-like glycosyltransferase
VTDPSQTSPWVRYRLPVLAAYGTLVFIPFLDLRDLWYPNEPHLAQVAQWMFTTGDWILPRHNGQPFLDYPPMLYWLASIFSHLLGGLSEFAMRLPCAIAAIAVGVATCAAGSRWYDARTGLAAGFVVMTFHRFAYEAISFRPDMLFTVMIATGVLAYAHGAGKKPQWEWRVAGFALLGLAMLVKGPLGLLLPGLVLTLWHGSRREWRRLVELAPLSLVSLAIYLPWFVACAAATGSDNILFELYDQNVQRFRAGGRGHEQPFHYYFTTMWFNMAPWAPMLPFAVWWIFRSGRRRDRNVQLALWWFGVFLVFLSVATTKRTHYLVPAYPAAALLLAPWIASLGRGETARPPGAPDPRPARYYAAALAVVLPVIAILLFILAGATEQVMARAELSELLLDAGRAMRLPLALLGVVLLAGGLWIGAAWWRGNARGGLVRLGLLHVPIFLLAYAWLLPALNPAKTYKPQSYWIREQIGDETHIGMVYPGIGRHKTSAFAYYAVALVNSLENPDQVEEFFARHPGSVVLVHDSLAGTIFVGETASWKDRVLREMWTGNDLYHVLPGP